MAEAKNQVTPEQAAAAREDDFARAQARREEMARRKEDLATGYGNSPQTPLTGLVVPVTPITEASIGERNKHILDSLRPGEPIIIFRAKDILSTMVLQHYMTLLESYVPYSEIIEDMNTKLHEFRTWQIANPDKVRIPD